MDIGEGVIVHRLLKVDGVENLDGVAMLQKGVAALNHDAAFGVSDHIGTVHLEKVWLQPKASFTGTRTADNPLQKENPSVLHLPDRKAPPQD